MIKKPRKNSRQDYAPHIPPEQAPRCEAPGCSEPGMYKAPRAPNQLHDYRWLCLDHIREHNARWDFFGGMSSQEIEAFMRDAVTGHRPTWNRETRLRDPVASLQDALYEFMIGQRKPKKATPQLSTKLRKALAVLDMDYPFEPRQLKQRYREMVKKYHPDVNQSDRFAEDKFKKITESYHLLAAHLKSEDYKPKP
ncbi:MAG: DnaJ domain-containing protein [Alphaproteobacteria bacterium]|nr:DnaJ domain-containing protein [Alphaproteobacteria bacterium]